MWSPYESFQPFRPQANASNIARPPLTPSTRKPKRSSLPLLSPKSVTFSSGMTQSIPVSHTNLNLNGFQNPFQSPQSAISPYQLYSNTLQNAQTPNVQPMITARPRRQSLPSQPALHSWAGPQQSMGYNSRGHNRKRSESYVARSPAAYPASEQPQNFSPFSPRSSSNDQHTIERPLKTKNYSQQNFELHMYLSTPPFSYSFLNKPDILPGQGFNGLHQYATRPPTSFMILKSQQLPWEIRIGGRSAQDKYLTVYEVLTAIYQTLRESPTMSEINILYSSSESKKKYNEITNAYGRRSDRENPYQQDYIRKIDWLCGRHVFNGLVSKKEKDKPVWTILFRGADLH